MGGASLLLPFTSPIRSLPFHFFSCVFLFPFLLPLFFLLSYGADHYIYLLVIAIAYLLVYRAVCFTYSLRITIF